MEKIELKEYTSKEEYKIIGNGVFAVDEFRKSKREINGNDLLNFLETERKQLESDIAEIEKQLAEKKTKLAENIGLKNEVLTVYKRIPKRLANGVVETKDGEYVYHYVKAEV